jgi:hypothetical protein
MQTLNESQETNQQKKAEEPSSSLEEHAMNICGIKKLNCNPFPEPESKSPTNGKQKAVCTMLIYAAI